MGRATTIYISRFYVEKLRKWLEEERSARFNFNPANEAWIRLVKPDGLFCSHFAPVFDNQIKKWKHIEDELDHDWKTAKQIEYLIQTTHRQRDTRCSIDGPILTSMIRKLQEGILLVQAWCKAASRETITPGSAGQMTDLVRDLRDRLTDTLPGALTALRSMMATSAEQDRRASAQVLLSTLRILKLDYTGISSVRTPFCLASPTSGGRKASHRSLKSRASRWHRPWIKC